MTNRILLRLLATLWLIGLALANGIAFADAVDDGLAWLLSHPNADHAWGGEPASPATPFQATTETLETLTTLVPPGNPVYQAGLGWLAAQETGSHLATTSTAGSSNEASEFYKILQFGWFNALLALYTVNKR